MGGRGLHGQLVNELGDRIMRGRVAPGDILDPELIATEFSVSRTVVREVLKFLAAKGLVGARQRYGTFVTERSQWNLLDSDVMTWRATGAPDPRLVLELDEVRGIIEPAAARMAAERRTPEELSAIQEAWESLNASYTSDAATRPDPAESDFSFHLAILAASGNELLEQFEVLLGPALHARSRLAEQNMTTLDFLDLHQQVLMAIEKSDPMQAEKKMRALMIKSHADSRSALGISTT